MKRSLRCPLGQAAVLGVGIAVVDALEGVIVAVGGGSLGIHLDFVFFGVLFARLFELVLVVLRGDVQILVGCKLSCLS